MRQETDISPLIRTKLNRPRISGDLVKRSHLLERLDRRRDRPFTLVSAPAGYGKSTLVSSWLETCIDPTAWISLDEHDGDLTVFLRYFLAALQSMFPDAAHETAALLDATTLPPPSAFAASLINELDAIGQNFFLVLDDYHLIRDTAVHDLLAELLRYPPAAMHLVLITRADPPLPLDSLRARRQMVEVRTPDLRFTLAEATVFLQQVVGASLSEQTIVLLQEKTEGWVTGLRLAGLILRHYDDPGSSPLDLHGDTHYIRDYLLSETLAHQPLPIQKFLLETSILDRLTGPLCEAVTSVDAPEFNGQAYLEWLEQVNLFIVPLDNQQGWYRYHHLFQELLQYRLKREYSPADIVALHTTAGDWMGQNGFIEEALGHFLTANNTVAAANLAARHRYALMNQTQWPRLDQWLRRFSPDILDQYPDLLMLQTWLLYHQGQYVALPAALKRLETALAQASLTPEAISHLQGEMSALYSLLFYFAGDAKTTIAHAQQSIENTPPELWIVRILARLTLAGARQMSGDLNRAYAAIYRGFEEETVQNNLFKATLLMTACDVHWIAADLHGMGQAADQCIMLSQQADSPQILNFGHYHRARVYYQQNNLDAAEQHFTPVVQQPYLNYGNCFAYSACGLALTHQARGRSDRAREVAEAAVKFILETGNTSLLPIARAFQAELVLRQGQLATAGQWAAQLDPFPPLQPVHGLFSPHLTLVKIWLAQNTPATRQQANDLLAQLRPFFEAIHNTRFLIEVLALQALLHRDEDDEAALTALEQAINLAQPGGFIRLFVDLGPDLARLLKQLFDGGLAPNYIKRILDAFVSEPRPDKELALNPQAARATLIEPLTRREQEILALLANHLSNNEIADKLVISPATVKRHTINIYQKLAVRNRQQAVEKALLLGILKPT